MLDMSSDVVHAIDARAEYAAIDRAVRHDVVFKPPPPLTELHMSPTCDLYCRPHVS